MKRTNFEKRQFIYEYQLIAIDNSIVEIFTSSNAAKMFRSYYHNITGELLDLKIVKK